MILIRGSVSEYIDKHGLRRRLKANVQHGAVAFGPGTVQQLAAVRKYRDIAVEDDDVPQALMTDLLVVRYPHCNYFKGVPYVSYTADRLRELGYPVEPIPTKRWARRRWLFWNDNGGAAGVYQ